MKPAKAFGLIGTPFGDNLRVLAITSETKGLSGRVYGRDKRGRATNAAARSCYGRFDDADTAEDARAAVQRVFDHHKPGVDHARAVLDKLSRARHDAVKHALENIRIDPVATLGPVA